jgi:hypothetical protein
MAEIISRRLRWAWGVARIRMNKDSYRDLVRIAAEMESLEDLGVDGIILKCVLKK